DEPGIRDEPIRRHYEVARGRHILQHAAREIELRSVARTEEAAEPVRSQTALCARLQLGGRRATQVGADADQNQKLRFYGAIFVLRVIGLNGTIRGRVRDSRIHLFDVPEHLRSTVQDPYGLSAPLDAHHHARLHFRNVDFDWS